MTKVAKLRHNEYYCLQETFDNLYADSQQGKVFNKLMEIISSPENIRLAYRNIKRNNGSKTYGTDKCTIEDIKSIPTDKYVEIVDLKYGKGVAVSAIDNTQMQMYALGIISNFGFMYDFDTIQMTIFQPRNGGISSQEKSVKDLIKWGENIVKPTAELAYDGIGEFNAGKWCLFCRASLRCKKYSFKYNSC